MKKRQYQIIAEQIGKRIDSGQYGIGTKLPTERDLCEGFGVSRPIVREAVIALETTGCVEVRHGSGAWVIARPSAKKPQAISISAGAVSPFEAMQARVAVESETAALAARLGTKEDFDELEACLAALKDGKAEPAGDHFKNSDLKFHMAIAKASKNSILEQLVEKLWDLRYSGSLSEFVFEKVEASGWRPTYQEHKDIFLAIKKRDEVGARKAMVTHLNRVIDAMLQSTETKEMEKMRQSLNSQRQRFAASAAVES